MLDELFKIKFISFGFIDLLDIFLVAILLYQIYRVLRGSIALNILFGLLSIVIIYLVVNSLGLNLLGFILSKFIEVWVILMLIVFQPEVRRFLLLIGQNYGNNFLTKIFRGKGYTANQDSVLKTKIAQAIHNLSESYTGALIVFAPQSQSQYYSAGVKLNAQISSVLIESIFQKKSPIHDGAVIVSDRNIEYAGVVLPVTDNTSLPKSTGLRHRAAVGITEKLNCIVLIVSEETGIISKAQNGKLYTNISNEELLTVIDDGLKSIF